MTEKRELINKLAIQTYSKITNEKVELIYAIHDRFVALVGDDKIIKISKNHKAVENEFKILAYLNKIKFEYSPKVYSKALIGDFSYIVKEYIPGDTLEERVGNMNDLEIDEIREQLINILDKIHSLDLSSVIKVPDKEIYFNQIIEDVKKYNISKEIETNIRSIVNNENIVFIHGDFNPRNIIVNNNNICGIIDWEFAEYSLRSDEIWDNFFSTNPGQEYFRYVMEKACIKSYKMYTLKHFIFRTKSDEKNIVDRFLIELSK